jgi:aminoglycoside phosphotransferase family enzyme
MATSVDARARAAQPLIGVESGFAAKVAFLSDPRHYPEGTERVERIETHMSCVFLTDRHAYKLKKPVCNGGVDLRTVSARHDNCTEELRLNRRLAPDVYLGTAALCSDPGGGLAFDEGAEAVDWLLKMRRLPAQRMLDRRIRERCVSPADIDAIVRRLCAFYRASPRVGVVASEYRAQFHDDVIANGAELSETQCGLPCEDVDRVVWMQLAALDRHRTMFDDRVHRGRIVEGHGDLRPEHICLEDEPKIIDCLDFSRVLRTLDIADELGYLALECEQLGAPGLREQIFASYRAVACDTPPEPLIHFYQSYRACVRAALALRHLREPLRADPGAWRSRALDYLQLAKRHADRCA